MNVGTDWKKFVYTLCDLGVKNSSKEIAEVINRNGINNVTWAQVAACKANYSRKNG